MDREHERGREAREVERGARVRLPLRGLALPAERERPVEDLAPADRAIARDRGDRAVALQHFKAAAGSGSTYGNEAAEEYVRLDLPENPGNYVAALVQTDATGKAYVIIENRAPVALANIVVTPVLVDANGRVLQQGSAVQIRGPVPAGERASAAISTGNLTAEQLRFLKARVESARLAQ